MTVRAKTHRLHSSLRAKKPADKMRRYRARLRAAGLRPVQIWVPDVRSPNFIKEARRQSLAARRDASERDAIAFIEAASDFSDWE